MGRAKAKLRAKSRSNTNGEIIDNPKKFSSKNPLAKKALTEDQKNPGLFRISCLVKPNARTDRIYIDGTQIFVNTTCPPVKGKANKAIKHLFHEILHVPKRNIRLLKGQTSSQKIFQIWAPDLTYDKIWNGILHKSE